MDEFWDNPGNLYPDFYATEDQFLIQHEIPVTPLPNIEIDGSDVVGQAEGSLFPVYAEGQEVIVPDLKEVIRGSLGVEASDAADINILEIMNESIELKSLFDYSPEERVTDGLSQIYGYPASDMNLWVQQMYPDTCAIVSQKFIIEDFVGVELTEDQLRDMAIDKGYYTPGHGTFPYEVGNILEDFGIPVLRSEENSFDDIVEKLSNNQKIIVGVNSNTIWNGSDSWSLIDLLHMPGADHAVQVIGYDSKAEIVILNDPGHPDGRGMTVPVSDFLHGWDAGNNFMVSTINPAPIPNA